MMTTKQVLDERFRDPRLKAIFAGIWPDYGTMPHESAFAIHGTTMHDFMNGGFYPIGGSKEIADHAAKTIEAHGGTCLLNHGVTEIIVKNQTAIGVRAEHKGNSIEFYAPSIVSNAGAFTTFGKLAPRRQLPRSEHN